MRDGQLTEEVAGECGLSLCFVYCVSVEEAIYRHSWSLPGLKCSDGSGRADYLIRRVSMRHATSAGERRRESWGFIVIELGQRGVGVTPVRDNRMLMARETDVVLVHGLGCVVGTHAVMDVNCAKCSEDHSVVFVGTRVGSLILVFVFDFASNVVSDYFRRLFL